MTTTFPISTPHPAARSATFATGNLVSIQNNTGVFRIHGPSAWADTGRSMPTHCNVTGPNGRLHLREFTKQWRQLTLGRA